MWHTYYAVFENNYYLTLGGTQKRCWVAFSCEGEDGDETMHQGSQTQLHDLLTYGLVIVCTYSTIITDSSAILNQQLSLHYLSLVAETK